MLWCILADQPIVLRCTISMQLSRPTVTTLMMLWVAECPRANPINTFVLLFPSSNDRARLSYWKFRSVKSVHRVLTLTEYWENVTGMYASSIFCRLHRRWKCLKLSQVATWLDLRLQLPLFHLLILPPQRSLIGARNVANLIEDWVWISKIRCDHVLPSLFVKSCWHLLFKNLDSLLNFRYPVLSN